MPLISPKTHSLRCLIRSWLHCVGQNEQKIMRVNRRNNHMTFVIWLKDDFDEVHVEIWESDMKMIQRNRSSKKALGEAKIKWGVHLKLANTRKIAGLIRPPSSIKAYKYNATKKLETSLQIDNVWLAKIVFIKMICYFHDIWVVLSIIYMYWISCTIGLEASHSLESITKQIIKLKIGNWSQQSVLYSQIKVTW